MELNYGWHNIVGNLGVIMIVGAYLLLQMNKISQNSIKYSVINAFGAAAVLLSLTVEFNLSAFFVEFFWLLISIYGLVRGLAEMRRRAGQPAADSPP